MKFYHFNKIPIINLIINLNMNFNTIAFAGSSDDTFGLIQGREWVNFPPGHDYDYDDCSNLSVIAFDVIKYRPKPELTLGFRVFGQFLRPAEIAGPVGLWSVGVQALEDENFEFPDWPMRVTKYGKRNPVLEIDIPEGVYVVNLNQTQNFQNEMLRKSRPFEVFDYY